MKKSLIIIIIFIFFAKQCFAKSEFSKIKLIEMNIFLKLFESNENYNNRLIFLNKDEYDYIELNSSTDLIIAKDKCSNKEVEIDILNLELLKVSKKNNNVEQIDIYNYEYKNNILKIFNDDNGLIMTFILYKDIVIKRTENGSLLTFYSLIEIE